MKHKLIVKKVSNPGTYQDGRCKGCWELGGNGRCEWCRLEMDRADAALTEAKRLVVDSFRRRDLADVCVRLELDSCEMGSRYDKAARMLGFDSEADYLVGSVT